MWLLCAFWSFDQRRVNEKNAQVEVWRWSVVESLHFKGYERFRPHFSLKNISHALFVADDRMDSTTMRFVALLLSVLSAQHNVLAFAPTSSFVTQSRVSSANMPLRHTSSLNMMDPSVVFGTTSSFFSTIGTNPLLSFADQGQNLAGIFFQSSLLPYLVFLYFLGFKGNRIPEFGNFGFQFILFFVLATIPSGIICRSTYGVSLANVDYLHGGAELLLTLSTLFIVSSCSLDRLSTRIVHPRTLLFSYVTNGSPSDFLI